MSQVRRFAKPAPKNGSHKLYLKTQNPIKSQIKHQSNNSNCRKKKTLENSYTQEL